jgi:hypothetical protein
VARGKEIEQEGSRHDGIGAQAGYAPRGLPSQAPGGSCQLSAGWGPL